MVVFCSLYWVSPVKRILFSIYHATIKLECVYLGFEFFSILQVFSSYEIFIKKKKINTPAALCVTINWYTASKVIFGTP